MLIKAYAVLASAMIAGTFPIHANACVRYETAEPVPSFVMLSTLEPDQANQLLATMAPAKQSVPSASDQSRQEQGVPGIDATTRPSKTGSPSKSGPSVDENSTDSSSDKKKMEPVVKDDKPIQDDDEKGSSKNRTKGQAEDTQAPPASPRTPLPSIETSAPPTGSSSKVGPVTDDQKMIKPVEGVTKGDKGNAKKAPDNPPETANVTVEDVGPISPTALKVATDLKMVDSINQLRDLKREHVYVPGQKVHSLEVVSVRQDLDEVLFSALLQTRRVLSILDRQISGYDAVARVLEDKRDQAIRNNNIINFTSGGALAVTQGAISIGTPTKFQNAGNELGVIAGGLTALISAYALKIQKGGKRNAEKDPNMLAPIFGLTPVESNKYPPVVWNYINDKEPGQKKTRREQLIERWVKLDYIEPLNEKGSKEHLERLAGIVPLHKEVTIDLLRDRIPMMQDVRSAVTGINESLDEILTFIRQP